MPGRYPHFYDNLDAILRSAKADCFLLSKLIGLLFLVNVSGPCPLNCYCVPETGLMQCHYLALQDIPRGIPHWVHNLSVIGNNITMLQTAAFRSNGTQPSNLTALTLTYNRIQTIEPSAFEDLPNLITLDLSYNVLSTIANDAFAGQTQLQVLKLNQALLGTAQKQFVNSQWIKHLKGLRTLEVAGNGLQSFPRSVQNLENLRVLNIGNNSIQRIDEETVLFLKRLHILVYLSPNPLICDCKLSEMISWLWNTSQVFDAPNLQCFAPANLNGTRLMSLDPDNFKCVNENLETASYVFFGIVLALIGVIFLMVLYLNRRGIKRWLNNFREACRDQMEGYHYRYEQDTDPRRSNASGI
ncbi:trophoblast glycoprotein-like [Spea bombifrons]|uniref:trophoblast glycoprotein-like n=1 Tax=Spea bombifrons TaxID=233779 RepID=UPI00234B7D9A|nr:trophoblast glycoprotein-like [Spea bombifrons]